MRGSGPTTLTLAAGVLTFSASHRYLDDLPGGGGTIPAWIPQYPGSKPANVVTKQEGPERSAEFSYTTADDARAVIAWYERTLKDKGFTIVGSTVFDASTALALKRWWHCGNNLAFRRTIGAGVAPWRTTPRER